MSRYHAETALLPDGWADDVLIETDDAGDIVAVTPATPATGAERLAGPVLPGMPNLHSHAFQRGMAGLAERAGSGDEDFWSWRGVMYRFVERLSPGHIEAIAAQLYVEMLKQGYTAVGEFHYVHHAADGTPYDDPAELSHRVIAAARRAGIGITHLPVLYTAAGFDGAEPEGAQRRFASSAEQILALVETLRRTAGQDPQIRIGVAPHSLRAAPAADLAAVVAGVRADDEMAPVHIHVAEQEREVAACLAATGARPVEWLLNHAPVDGRWCLIHATHMSGAEVRALAASDALAGLCPTTEANLGDGVFSLGPYLESGGRFGIGSDSHITVDPAAELRLLEYGQRLVLKSRAVVRDASGPSVGAALVRLALAGGGQALGRQIGALAPGCRADLIVLDRDHPALLGRTGDTLLDAWVFAAGPSAVRDVMVGGQWAVRDGHHTEEATILAAYRDAIEAAAG